MRVYFKLSPKSKMNPKTVREQKEYKEENLSENNKKEIEMAKKKSSSKKVKRSSVGVMKIRFKVSKKKRK